MRSIERGSPSTFKGIIDTTFRDGAQSPLVAEQISRFSTQQRLDLFDAMHTYGVKVFEVFSPFVNPAEAEDLAALRERINTIPSDMRPSLAAHVRCDARDAQSALNAGVRRLHFYMGADEDSRATGHGKSIKEMRARIKDTLSGLHDAYPDIYVRFSGEHAFKTNRRKLYSVFDSAVENGADALGIPDTTGIARDTCIKSLVRSLKKKYQDVDLEGHNHNDYGYAIPNSVTEVTEGVSYISTSIWGLAERSGIASMTGLLFNLHRLNPDYVKDYLIGSSYKINTMMGDILHLPVPYNEPVSLTNRTHVAGVHTKSIQNYEQSALEQFGVTRSDLLVGADSLVGPLSGWHNIRYYLRELEFFDVTDDQAKAITKEFKSQSRDMNGRKDAEERLKRIASKYDLPHLPRHEQGRIVYERAGVTV